MDTDKGTRKHPGESGTAGPAQAIGRTCLLAAAFLAPLLLAKQGRDLKLLASQAMALAGLAVTHAFLIRQSNIVWTQMRPVIIALSTWMAFVLLSWVRSPSPSSAVELTNTALFMSVFILAGVLLRPSDWKRLSSIWLASFIVVGGYAIAQRLGLDPVEEYRRWNSQDRVFSTFGNPDFLGAHAAFLLPLFLGAASGAATSPLRRFSWSAAAVCDAVVLFLTFSRGAWTGAVAGILTWAVLAFPARAFMRKLPLFLLAAFGLVIVLNLTGILTPGHLLRRTDRLLLWQGTAGMIRVKPLTGWGLGSFASEYPPFTPPAFAERMKADNTFAEHPHSEYLNVAVECGLPGLGIFIWLLVVAARYGMFALRGPGRAHASAPIGALVAVAVHMLVDRNFRLASTAVPFWILAGALAARARPAFAIPCPGAAPVTRASGPVWQRMPALLLLPGALLCIFLAARLMRPLAASYRVEADKDFLQQTSNETAAQLELQRPRKGSDPQFLVALGNAYAREKQFTRAVEVFREALRLDPNLAAAANNLGNSYFMMSRFDEAIDAYRIALRIDPRHKDARFNMAYAYFFKRDIKKALEECEILLRQDPAYFKALQLKSQLAP